MTAARIVSGTWREVWREAVPLNGGTSDVIPTGISAYNLARVNAVCYIDAVAGAPNIGGSLSINALNKLVVTIANTAAPGNTAIFTLDVIYIESTQQSNASLLPAPVHVVGGANLSPAFGQQGWQGPQGWQGWQGPGNLPGPQGQQGNQGSQGGQGPQGWQGWQGLVGMQGQQGPQGAQGAQGNQGRQGWQGWQGPANEPGTQGAQGIQGNQGQQGPQGWQGWQGPANEPGVQGIQGNQGWQGPQGWQGWQGPGNLPGPQGEQGLQGVQGGQGWQGWQGPGNLPGDQGPQGVQGIQGNQGWQGWQGPGNVPGEQGPQGVQGPQGNQGVQGNQGWQGWQGPGNLPGDQGAQGAQGSQGNQGWQGWQGPGNLPGAQGPQGAQGWQGWQGVQGPQGAQGRQGWQGWQGPAGTDSGAGSVFFLLGIPQQISGGDPVGFSVAGDTNASQLTTYATNGLQNAKNVFPLIMYGSGTIDSMRFTLDGAAISQGLPIVGSYMRIDFYLLNWNTRTSLGSFNVPLDDAKVGINNSPTTADYKQTVLLSNINIAVTAGDAIAVVWVPQSGNGSKINAIINLFGSLKVVYT